MGSITNNTPVLQHNDSVTLMECQEVSILKRVRKYAYEFRTFDWLLYLHHNEKNLSVGKSQA